MYSLIKIICIISLGWSFSLSAAEFVSPDRDSNGNILPTPKGDVCVAPVEEMRINHMTMLLHQRDRTVQQGIRDQQASLTECINCHVTPDSSGIVARNGNEGFFCSSCHLAASVKIDCFECHADRPAEMISQVGPSGNMTARLPYALRLRLGDAPNLAIQ